MVPRIAKVMQRQTRYFRPVAPGYRSLLQDPARDFVRHAIVVIMESHAHIDVRQPAPVGGHAHARQVLVVVFLFVFSAVGTVHPKCRRVVPQAEISPYQHTVLEQVEGRPDGKGQVALEREIARKIDVRLAFVPALRTGPEIVDVHSCGDSQTDAVPFAVGYLRQCEERYLALLGRIGQKQLSHCVDEMNESGVFRRLGRGRSRRDRLCGDPGRSERRTRDRVRHSESQTFFSLGRAGRASTRARLVRKRHRTIAMENNRSFTLCRRCVLRGSVCGKGRPTSSLSPPVKGAALCFR